MSLRFELKLFIIILDLFDFNVCNCDRGNVI